MLVFVQQTVHVVDFGRPQPVTRFWQRLRGVGLSQQLRCCAAADAEAFLLWRPGDLPVVWTPSAGVAWLFMTCDSKGVGTSVCIVMHAGAECLNAGGNVAAAAARKDGRAWLLLTPSGGVLEVPADSAAAAEDADEDGGGLLPPAALQRNTRPSAGVPPGLCYGQYCMLQSMKDLCMCHSSCLHLNRAPSANTAGARTSASGQQRPPDDVFAVLAYACAAGTVSAAAYAALQAAGAFDGQGAANPIAQYSTRWGKQSPCADDVSLAFWGRFWVLAKRQRPRCMVHE